MISLNVILPTALWIFVSAEALMRNQCVSSGTYAMTWDDGPAQFTGQLLDTLRSKNVKATFHVTTQYLTDPNVQSMIQRIARDGHLIGLRAEASWNLMNMTDDQITSGIARQANVLANFIGYTPKFIRLAYKGYDDRVLRAVESTGLIATTHNLETYDYNNDGGKIYEAVDLNLSLRAKGSGSFISIQHDGVQQSVAITGRQIERIKQAGYKFVTLDECLGLSDQKKNKEPLKGGNDSIDFGTLSAPIEAGSPMINGESGSPEFHSGIPDPSPIPIPGRLSSKSSASRSTFSYVTIATAMVGLFITVLLPL